MKKIITMLVSFSVGICTFAQNSIGIGTTTPHASAALDISSNNKGLLIPRMTTAERTAIASPAKGLMVFDNTTSTYWYHNGTVWTEMTGGGSSGSSGWTSSGTHLHNSNAGNIGIGTDVPAYKLDVNGRMRIRQAGNQTAGTWLDGPASPAIGFMGVYDNNTIGLYGAGGGSWALNMNTTTGYVGIGTPAPTADLDINGTLRIRGNAPAAGATLVSTDINGNTRWQRCYAFKTEGLINLEDRTTGMNSIFKVLFNTAPAYNIGQYYDPFNAYFVAPVRGVYNFNVSLQSINNANSGWPSFRLHLMRSRNNVHTEIASHHFGINADNSAILPQMDFKISGDFLLEPNDQIWVRVFTGDPHTVYGDAARASFSGHMIIQL